MSKKTFYVVITSCPEGEVYSDLCETKDEVDMMLKYKDPKDKLTVVRVDDVHIYSPTEDGNVDDRTGEGFQLSLDV